MICAVVLEHDSIVLLECNGGWRFRSGQSWLYLFFHYPEDIMCSKSTKIGLFLCQALTLTLFMLCFLCSFRYLKTPSYIMDEMVRWICWIDPMLFASILDSGLLSSYASLRRHCHNVILASQTMSFHLTCLTTCFPLLMSHHLTMVCSSTVRYPAVALECHLLSMLLPMLENTRYC
jgi:hypothetical protein